MTDSCQRGGSCINLCFEAQSRGSCKYFCAVSLLQIVILLHTVESTVNLNPHKWDLSDSDRLLNLHHIISSEGPFLVYGSVCPHCDTLSCFFVGGHPIFFRIDRSENVDP